MFGRTLFATILLLFCVALTLFIPSALLAEAPPTPRPKQLPTALPGGGMFPAWMTPPARGHTQADAGAVVYYYNCMACHGDRGQGLTTEWRAQWDVEHQNCSKSGCHGARHDPEGFTFPKNFAPAIVGGGTLVKYQTAQDLYDFVSQKMPYQSPGALSGDEYWQLVAFLLDRRGLNVSQINQSNATSILLHQRKPPSPFPVPWLAAMLVPAGLAALTLLLVLRRKQRSGWR
jgi:mono/diheme cytochrome c family protein